MRRAGRCRDLTRRLPGTPATGARSRTGPSPEPHGGLARDGVQRWVAYVPPTTQLIGEGQIVRSTFGR